MCYIKQEHPNLAVTLTFEVEEEKEYGDMSQYISVYNYEHN